MTQYFWEYSVGSGGAFSSVNQQSALMVPSQRQFFQRLSLYCAMNSAPTRHTPALQPPMTNLVLVIWFPFQVGVRTPQPFQLLLKIPGNPLSSQKSTILRWKIDSQLIEAHLLAQTSISYESKQKFSSLPYFRQDVAVQINVPLHPESISNDLMQFSEDLKQYY